MNMVLKELSRISLLALSLVMWSCDDLGQSTAPETLEPEGAAVFNHATSPTLSGTSFVFPGRIEPLVNAVSGSAVFTNSGGTISVGAHELVVPPRAVRLPTLFTFTVEPGSELVVDLSAYEQDSSGAWTVEVGSKGFKKDVVLNLDFKEVRRSVPDPTKLVVLWLKQSSTTGEVVPTPSEVDTNRKWVKARLSHFSDYGLAWPE